MSSSIPSAIARQVENSKTQNPTSQLEIETKEIKLELFVNFSDLQMDNTLFVHCALSVTYSNTLNVYLNLNTELICQSILTGFKTVLLICDQHIMQ